MSANDIHRRVSTVIDAAALHRHYTAGFVFQKTAENALQRRHPARLELRVVTAKLLRFST